MTDQPKQTINIKPVVVKRDWLVIAILGFVVAVLWIGVSVYHVLSTPNIPPPEQQRLTLFSTDLDDGVIDELAKKKQVLGQPIDENTRVIFILPGENQAVQTSTQ